MSALAQAPARLFLPEPVESRDDSETPFQLAGNPGEFFFVPTT